MATNAPSRPLSYCGGRAFQYEDEYLEPGQVFVPRGKANDAALYRVGYLVEVGPTNYPDGIEEVPCLQCGKVFVDVSYLSVHESNHDPDMVVDIPNIEDLPEGAIPLPGTDIGEA